jgi:hypothetical protein
VPKNNSKSSSFGKRTLTAVYVFHFNSPSKHLEADCKPSPWHILRGDDLIKRPLSIDAWEALTMEPHGSREHLSVSPSYKNGFHFIDVYNFLRDRFRSVWQDLTVQHCPKHRVSWLIYKRVF